MLSTVLFACVNDVAGCWGQYGKGSDLLSSFETTGDEEGGLPTAASGNDAFCETDTIAWGNVRVSTTGGTFATENEVSVGYVVVGVDQIAVQA